MDNYNNGPVQPFQNNNSGYPPYYTRPTRHPGSGFATASMVLGIISIMTAFLGTVYPPLVCGGLSIILGLLSKGGDPVLLPNARVGVITAIVGLIVNVAVVAASFALVFGNPQMREEFHDQLNEYSEYLYGESFDEMWEELH